MRRIVFLSTILLAGCPDRPLQPCDHPSDAFASADFSRPDLAQKPLPQICLEIVTVDVSGLISNFHPDTLTWTDVGILSCPTLLSDAGVPTPFSMAVARDATAWVLYSSGELFHVDTLTLKCDATAFVPNQQQFLQFGMGFVSNSPGSDAETLYIGGTSPNQLGSIDLTNLQVTRLGVIPGSPELTGTGLAELWGFFPSPSASFVAQIDRASGALTNKLPLPGLAGTPVDWAFGFWGGDFWIFLERQTDPSTRVYQLTRAGVLKVAIGYTRRNIVGAGVSDCAPTKPLDMGGLGDMATVPNFDLRP